MQEKRIGVINTKRLAVQSFVLLLVLGTAYLVMPNHAMAQDAAKSYPSMGPRLTSDDQYLMPDQTAEIALARTAAPESISRDADIMVLGPHGFETAVKGKNGFVCIVERSVAQGRLSPILRIGVGMTSIRFSAGCENISGI